MYMYSNVCYKLQSKYKQTIRNLTRQLHPVVIAKSVQRRFVVIKLQEYNAVHFAFVNQKKLCKSI